MLLWHELPMVPGSDLLVVQVLEQFQRRPVPELNECALGRLLQLGSDHVRYLIKRLQRVSHKEYQRTFLPVALPSGFISPNFRTAKTVSIGAVV